MTRQTALEGDPVSGIEASGKVANETGEDQERIVLYAVATKCGEVVAAGRGAIEHMRADAKPQGYDIFFIGDPKGADVEVTHDGAGRPLLAVSGTVAEAAARCGVLRWHLSITHDGGLSVAMVVAEG